MRGERNWMEIERINENTIKFYISYLDIEDRGFEREEIWYNRERSEQLFWQMMEEVNHKEEFVVEGPLWIQVQALEKGLEVIVTKSKLSKNDSSTEKDSTIDIPVDERIENILEEKFGPENKKSDDSEEEAEEKNLSIIVSFNDFEDVIQLSHHFQEAMEEEIEETLYYYQEKYYLFIKFAEDLFDSNDQEDFISQVLEFSNDTNLSIHLLEEYGKKIFEDNVLSQVRSYFSIQ